MSDMGYFPKKKGFISGREVEVGFWYECLRARAPFAILISIPHAREPGSRVLNPVLRPQLRGTGRPEGGRACYYGKRGAIPYPQPPGLELFWEV